MNVLVIDHEKVTVQKLKDLLFEIDESIQVVGITDGMSAAAEWLSRNQVPDIILANAGVFADIKVKGRKDIKALVTFSTNHEEYNFQAFRYKTIRQILRDMAGTEERLMSPGQVTSEVVARPLTARNI